MLLRARSSLRRLIDSSGLARLSFDFERLVEFPIVKVDGRSKASAEDHVTRPLDGTEVKSELYSSHAIVVKPA